MVVLGEDGGRMWRGLTAVGTLGFLLSFFRATRSCCGCSPQGQLMVTLMLSAFCCRSTTICGSDLLTSREKEVLLLGQPGRQIGLNLCREAFTS